MITTARELDRVVRDLSTILEMRKSSHDLLSKVNMEEELNLMRVSLEREFSETDAVMEADFSAAPAVMAVRPLLDSILLNLISNAIKYRDPVRPPRILIRTEHINGETCLSVTDNGLGIDLEAFGGKLFTLYGRFHSHVDGKGLGLYLVKTHVQAMGGRIEVESEPGKGSTFRVFFKD
jgi:signal transduction histidine kinase